MAFKQRVLERINESLRLSKNGDELGQRIAARQSLISFVQYTFPQYVPEPFHYRLARELEDVVSGKTKRLMIFAPPQHGKSQLVSVHLPAYWLGKHPDMPVILSSYAASLAESKSRQTRTLVESDGFGRVFREIRTQWNSRAVQQWDLKGYRGSMLAVGVGGPITGHGAQLAIIDDPFSSWEMAHRQLQREKVWNWYRGTFRTRVWDKGAIILIMTRWHQDDLAGRLIEHQGEQWKVLRFPAISESQQDRDKNNEFLRLKNGEPDLIGRIAGQPLCPIRYPLGALQDIRRDVGSSVWSAEYQGVPRPSEGSLFKRYWFSIMDVIPAEIVERVRYWDRAGSENAGDYTVGLLMAKSRTGIYYIEDVVRGQWSPLQTQNIIKQTAAMDGKKVKIYVEQEGGSSGKESTDTIIRELAGYPVYADKPSGSKEVRAHPFVAQAEAGNVRLIKGTWNTNYIEELITFPSGRNDDQVDASSGAFNKLHLTRKTVSVSSVVSAQNRYS